MIFFLFVSAQKIDTKGLNFIRGDYVIVKHTKGEFLAFIFDVEQYIGKNINLWHS